MFTEIFQAFLLTTLLGTAFAAIVWLIKFITKKHFSAAWHYYIWLVVLALMLVPVKADLQKIQETAVGQVASEWWQEAEGAWGSAVADSDNANQSIFDPVLQQRRASEAKIESGIAAVAPVWFTVALSLFLVKILGYGGFLRKIRKTTEPAECPALSRYTVRSVQVRCGKWVQSPQLVGILRPILLMPDKEITGVQLQNVLAHEMTHLRRKDMLLKWILVLSKCVHWFNPVVYLVGREMELACEVSCDLEVTAKMNPEEKKQYADTILHFLQGKETKEYTLSMGMAGTRSMLKERFLQIKEAKKVNWFIRMSAFMFSCSLLLTGAFCSAHLMHQAFPDVEGLELSNYTHPCDNCGMYNLYGDYYYTIRSEPADVGMRVWNGYIYEYLCRGCGTEYENGVSYHSTLLTEEAEITFWEQIKESVAKDKRND